MFMRVARQATYKVAKMWPFEAQCGEAFKKIKKMREFSGFLYKKMREIKKKPR